MFRTESGQLLVLINFSFIYSVYNSYILWYLVSTFGHTAISRKVVGKIVHSTIPKGNMGYDQYTVPDDCSCRTYICCFPLALANTFPWPFLPILSNFFEKKRTQNHPQCLSGLSRTFPDNLSRNSCILNAFPWPGNLLRTFSVHSFRSFNLIGGHRVSKTQFFAVVVLRCIISLSFLSQNEREEVEN